LEAFHNVIFCAHVFSWKPDKKPFQIDVINYFRNYTSLILNSGFFIFSSVYVNLCEIQLLYPERYITCWYFVKAHIRFNDNIVIINLRTELVHWNSCRILSGTIISKKISFSWLSSLSIFLCFLFSFLTADFKVISSSLLRSSEEFSTSESKKIIKIKYCSYASCLFLWTFSWITRFFYFLFIAIW